MIDKLLSAPSISCCCILSLIVRFKLSDQNFVSRLDNEFFTNPSRNSDQNSSLKINLCPLLKYILKVKTHTVANLIRSCQQTAVEFFKIFNPNSDRISVPKRSSCVFFFLTAIHAILFLIHFISHTIA